MTETKLLPPDIEATVERLLTLPEDQRLAIGRRLIAGINQHEVEEAWEREIAQRIHEIETGAVELIPADVVFREAEERLNAHA